MTTDEIREQIRENWAGQEPDDIAMAFLEDLETLVANDPNYFANGRGNSLAHTLQMAANTVVAASGEREAA